MPLSITGRVAVNRRKTPERAVWLNRLPDALRNLEQRWSLTLGAPFDHEKVSCAWVAPVKLADGSPAVLKLGMPHMEGEDAHLSPASCFFESSNARRNCANVNDDGGFAGIVSFLCCANEGPLPHTTGACCPPDQPATRRGVGGVVPANPPPTMPTGVPPLELQFVCRRPRTFDAHNAIPPATKWESTKARRNSRTSMMTRVSRASYAIRRQFCLPLLHRLVRCRNLTFSAYRGRRERMCSIILVTVGTTFSLFSHSHWPILQAVTSRSTPTHFWRTI